MTEFSSGIPFGIVNFIVDAAVVNPDIDVFSIFVDCADVWIEFFDFLDDSFFELFRIEVPLVDSVIIVESSTVD
jgi:hypothetical protein